MNASLRLLEKKTMGKIIYNKLVRDKIPQIIASTGKISRCETLSATDFQAAIDKKLEEELKEYLAEGDVTELADLLEVLYAAAKARGYSREELERIRKEKAEKRGAFDQKILLLYVEE